MKRNVFRYIDRENQYYPTPAKLIRQILDNIDSDLYSKEYITFLEPCAGDGAICREVKSFFSESERIQVDINCIEIEEVLRNSLRGQGFNVVGNDFEEYKGFPIYDLIIMNPPFSKGAKFLLSAYDLLNANGILVCILNAETVKNICNRDRELLKALIDKHGAVEFIENAFSDADKKTEVEIAVVCIEKPAYANEFDAFGNLNTNVLSQDEQLYETLKQQAEIGIVPFDKIESSLSLYRNSVKSIFTGIETMHQIKINLDLLNNEAKEFGIDITKFFKIIQEYETEKAREKSIIEIRKMIWSYILKLTNMDQYVFSKQRSDFYNQLDKGSASLPFTREYIRQFLDNIFLQREEYLKKGIEDLFEQITSYHNGNKVHKEGWKTNKNWKINKKIIVDWGVEFRSYDPHSFGGTGLKHGNFSTRGFYNRDWIDDLDRIVRRIDKNPAKYGQIKELLDNKFRSLGNIYVNEPFDNTCETPYFHLKFFKKGTLHITFKDDKILEELNLIGAKLRRDLGYDDFGKSEEYAKGNPEPVATED